MGEIGDENEAAQYDLVLQYAQEALNQAEEFHEEQSDDSLPAMDEMRHSSSSPTLNEATTNEKEEEDDLSIQCNDGSSAGSDGVVDKEDDGIRHGCRQCRAEAAAAGDKSPDSSPSGTNSGRCEDELRSKRSSTSSGPSFLATSQNPEQAMQKKKKKKKVGHYLLEDIIGQGSYASVHVATHLPTRQKVAVKVVSKKSLVLNEACRHHFRREALLLPRLNHPNIIQLFEAMETPNSYYLAFELVTGGHLLTLLSHKGNLTEEESRVFMKQIVSAVDHLHQSDIVHRDIRLENILMDANNHKVKLVDFGFSTVCHMNELTTQCGCPVYAAPEVFAGRRYGRPVDIWSLGICFYGMLLGRLPFLPVSNSLSQLFSIILKGCLIPTHLTPSCQNLLSRMLDQQEGRRITIEEILQHHWLTFPDSQPIRRYSSLPKRLPSSSVDQHVVKYMCGTFRFNETDIMNSVLDRRLTSSAATYHILRGKINAGKERRGQTPMTYKAPDKSRILHNTKVSATTALPAVTSHSAISTKSLSPHKKSATNKPGHPRPGRSKSPNRKAQKSDSSNTYKSYILVLKQSRLAGAEPTMPTESTASDLVHKSPPFFTVDPTNSSSLFPAISKSDSMSVKHFMRIDTNNQVDLGVTGTSPLLHGRISTMDFNSPGPSTSSASNSRSSASLRPSTVTAPPPVPPNSSLGIESVELRPKSPGMQLSKDGLSSPSGTLITNRTLPLVKTPPKTSPGPTFPSLSSLRESFAADMWNRSRMNIRLRPKPTVSLLRSKKSQPATAEIRVEGRSQQRIDDKDSRPFDGYVTWGNDGDVRRNSEGDSHSGNQTSQDKVNNFLHSLPTSEPEPFEEPGVQISETTAVENGIQRSITLASIPTWKKSNPANAVPDTMVRIVSMHSATRTDSPPLFRNEMESRLSQSLERADDFLTPVTRVTITTIQKDS